MRLLPAHAQVVIVLLGIACTGGSSNGTGATDQPAAAPAATTAPCVSMNTPEMAGAVLVVGLPGVTTVDHPLVDRVAAVGVGGVMLRRDNLLELEQARALVNGLRDRLGEETLVAVDEEGGRVSSMRALGDTTPSARRLGREGPEAGAQAGARLGELLRSIGIDWIFAPVVDLDDGPAGGVIGDRSYGGDPQVVAASASAFAEALRDKGIAITLKHFPGHGGEGDPHLGGTIDDSTEAALVASDLVPFRRLVAEGAEAVMVGHVAYPQVWGPMPASLEPLAYGALRSFGFGGVAMTDALGMGAVYNRWGFDLAPAMAIAAGADMALVNQGDRVEELPAGIVAAVERGDLSRERLKEATNRVRALRGQGEPVCGAR